MGRKPKIAAAMRELMQARGHHAWTLEELREQLALRGTRADFSTVFRAATRMEAEGLVRRVDLDDGRTHFEVRDEHHDHLRCSICGEVTPVPCGALSAAMADMEAATGFRISSHRLVLTGVCGRCLAAEGSPARPAMRLNPVGGLA